jgi:hypothetical protein
VSPLEQVSLVTVPDSNASLVIPLQHVAGSVVADAPVIFSYSQHFNCKKHILLITQICMLIIQYSLINGICHMTKIICMSDWRNNTGIHPISRVKLRIPTRKQMVVTSPLKCILNSGSQYAIIIPNYHPL